MADYEVKGRMTLDSTSFVASADRASAALNNVNNYSLTSALRFSLLRRAALGAALAVGGIGAAGIKAASDYQQADIAFTTMLGSAEKSTAFLKDMRDFAAATPFELPQLLQGARRLMAMGFAAEEVKPMLIAVGDAASGLGVGAEGIDRITLALGQMKAKGKVSGEEMRQLAEAGVPAWQYLAQATGKTTAEMMALGQKGAIPAEQAIAVLTYGMENGIGTARGFAGMMDKQSHTMAGLASTIKDNLRNAFVDFFNANFAKQFTGMLEKFAPVAGTMLQNVLKVVTTFILKFGQILGGIMTIIKPLFQDFLIPAFKIAGGAIYIVVSAFAALGSMMMKHQGVIKAIVDVVGLLAVAYGALYVGAKLQLGLQALQVAWGKLVVMWQNRQTIATTTLTAAQRLLNLTMAFNPIGLVIAAIALLIGGFMLLWKHSEGFRTIMIAIGKVGVSVFAFLLRALGVMAEGWVNIITGPLKLFLKLLSFISPDAKKAYDGLSTMTKGVGKFFDDAATKVEGFKGKLDSMGKTAVQVKDKVTTKKTTPKGAVPTIDFGAGNSASAQNKADTLAGQVQDLKDGLKAYNDFIQNDFITGFLQDSTSARDAVMKGLDEVKKVFDLKAKMLSGKALTDLNNAFNKLDEVVRGFIPQAMATAAALEQVNKDLDVANKALEDAIKNRQEAVAKFTAMLRNPFGEPSEIQKALGSASSTVDSIISMYDSLVETINQRYSGLDQSGKNALISALTDQTASLVKLSKERDNLIQTLDDQKKKLEDILNAQASFKTSVTGSLRDFVTALADLSKGDSSTTIKVIKTASGLVVTQMQQATSGVDTITTQLKDRLSQVTAFANNINSLLTRGLSKEYIAQLLAAGPEAAASTAALLASAGDDQIAQINSLYTQVDALTSTFGDQMATSYYDQAVKAQEALIKGTQDKLDAVKKQMDSITASVTASLQPLASLGTNLGNDLAQGLVDSLTKRKAELVALAESIAAAISAAMAAALSSIGVSGAATYIPSGGGTPPPVVDQLPAVVDQPYNPLTGNTPDAASPIVEQQKAASSALTKYTIKAGDTLSAIAKANGESLTQLLKDNPVFTTNPKYQNGNMIWAGGTVKIASPAEPATNYAGSGAGVNTTSLAGILAASGTTNNNVNVTINTTQPVDSATVEASMARILRNTGSGRFAE